MEELVVSGAEVSSSRISIPDLTSIAHLWILPSLSSLLESYIVTHLWARAWLPMNFLLMQFEVWGDDPIL